MSLEKIIEKILDDAKKEAEAIIKDAEERRLSELEQAKADFLRQANEIIEKAKKEAEVIRQKSNSRMLLEERKSIASFQNDAFKEVVREVSKELREKRTDILLKLFEKMIAEVNPGKNVKLRLRGDLKKKIGNKLISNLSKSFSSQFLLEDEEPEGADLELTSDGFKVKFSLEDFLMQHKVHIAKKIFVETKELL